METKTTAAEEAWEGLTTKERAVLMYLFTAGQPSHLADIQAKVFGDLGTGTSPTRNQLRNLVGGKLARKTREGHYQITAKGRRAVPGRRDTLPRLGGHKGTKRATAKRPLRKLG